MLGEDPDLAALARTHGAQLTDLRRPPERLTLPRGRLLNASFGVLLTVGTTATSAR